MSLNDVELKEWQKRIDSMFFPRIMDTKENPKSAMIKTDLRVIFSPKLIESSLAYALFSQDKVVTIRSVSERERLHLKNMSRKMPKIKKRGKNLDKPIKHRKKRRDPNHIPRAIAHYRTADKLLKLFYVSPYTKTEYVQTFIKDYFAFIKLSGLRFSAKYFYRFIACVEYAHYLVPLHEQTKKFVILRPTREDYYKTRIFKLL